MGKKERKLKLRIKREEEEESLSEEDRKNSFSFIDDNSADEDEGNEDLSLRIAEKAAVLNSPSKAALNGPVLRKHHDGTVSTPAEEAERSTRKKAKTKKKKRTIDASSIEPSVLDDDAAKEDGNVNEVDIVDNVSKAETDPVANVSSTEPDNLVLRKLLRGPRYFDPPDTSWGACYNCGEEGHKTAECPAERRKRPCFLCGSLEHNFKQCTKVQDCFICKKGGHRSKDCPDKGKIGSHVSKFCLRCGDSGHEMFSCRNDYHVGDLKEIQCYVCKKFGHLCCVNSADAGPTEVSCYRCGQLGHIGLACARLREEASGAGTPSSCYKCGEEGHFVRDCLSSTKANPRSRAETYDTGSPSSCYKCGGEGHFARECFSSTKAYRHSNSETNDAGTPSSCYKCGGEGHFARECRSSAKRSRDYSTTRFVEDKSYLRSMSEPHDLVKRSKKKKFLSDENGYDNGYENGYTENGYSVPRKLRARGGWTADDPEDIPLPRRKAQKENWGSPSTPSSKKRHKIHASNGGSKDQPFRNTPTRYPGKGFYSASRFSNTSNDHGSRYDRW